MDLGWTLQAGIQRSLDIDIVRVIQPDEIPIYNPRLTPIAPARKIQTPILQYKRLTTLIRHTARHLLTTTIINRKQQLLFRIHNIHKRFPL